MSILARYGSPLFCACALAYLAGGVLPTAQFALAVGTILFPAAALLAQTRTMSSLEPGLRVVAVGTCLIAGMLPWFYLRRAIPLPWSCWIPCSPRY